MKRTETKQIRICRLTIGGQDRVLIQSMCKHKTSHVEEVVKEINECAKLGADMMRVSILDEEDAQAIKEIKKGINIYKIFGTIAHITNLTINSGIPSNFTNVHI